MRKYSSPLFTVAFCLLFICGVVSPSYGQQIVIKRPETSVTLDSAAQKEIVETIAGILDKQYVFPDKAKQMSDMLKAKLKNGAYSKLTDPQKLRQQILEDLLKVQPDKHLNLAYFPPQAGGFSYVTEKDSDEKKQNAMKTEEMAARAKNFGLTKVEILEGNIGYLRIASFNFPLAVTKPALAAAVKLLENSDAIILDVRNNLGGNLEYVNLLASYFFDKETLLGTYYNRPTNKITNLKTFPVETVLAGKRLYILTSAASASGGEALAYDLQSFKKAIVVGEKTSGAANSMDTTLFQGSYGSVAVMVPDSQIINAASKTNWEGTGVQPDVAVAAEKALFTAHKLALNETAQAARNEPIKMRNAQIIAKLEYQEKQQRGGAKMGADLSAYAGKYGERTISFEDGSLFLQRAGGPKLNLIETGDSVFQIDIPGVEKPTLTFKKENGKVTGYFIKGQDGNEVFIEKER